MSVETDTFEYENLIAGDQKQLVNRSGTVAIGQSWERGTLVGKLTASGFWQLCDFQAVSDYDDFGVTVETIDTLDGNTTTSSFYVEGEFNQDAITYGYGDDEDDWRETLAGHGIYLRATVATTGIQ